MSTYQDAFTVPDLIAGGANNANAVIKGVTCLASVFIGAAVYLDATNTAINAIASNLATSNVIGIVEAKPSSTICDIRVSGVTPSILSGLDVTKVYFLSSGIAGQLTITPPITSGHILLRLGQPFSATELVLQKGIRTVRL